MTVISPSTREEIVRRLVNEFQPEAVYLFGSYAWGKPGEESDLDLLVILPDSSESPIQLAVRAQHSLRGIRAAVDVFWYVLYFPLKSVCHKFTLPKT